MFFTLLDPSLLFYEQEEWEEKKNNFCQRLEVLGLHVEMIKKYDQKVATTIEFSELITTSFPWNAIKIPEVYDLRRYIFDNLPKYFEYISVKNKLVNIEQEEEVLFKYVKNKKVIKEWLFLLFSCINSKSFIVVKSQIATRHVNSFSNNKVHFSINDTETEKKEICVFPIVWNEASWEISYAKKIFNLKEQMRKNLKEEFCIQKLPCRSTGTHHSMWGSVKINSIADVPAFERELLKKLLSTGLVKRITFLEFSGDSTSPPPEPFIKIFVTTRFILTTV